MYKIALDEIFEESNRFRVARGVLPDDSIEVVPTRLCFVVSQVDVDEEVVEGDTVPDDVHQDFALSSTKTNLNTIDFFWTKSNTTDGTNRHYT